PRPRRRRSSPSPSGRRPARSTPAAGPAAPAPAGPPSRRAARGSRRGAPRARPPPARAPRRAPAPSLPDLGLVAQHAGVGPVVAVLGRAHVALVEDEAEDRRLDRAQRLDGAADVATAAAAGVDDEHDAVGIAR